MQRRRDNAAANTHSPTHHLHGQFGADAPRDIHQPHPRRVVHARCDGEVEGALGLVQQDLGRDAVGIVPRRDAVDLVAHERQRQVIQQLDVARLLCEERAATDTGNQHKRAQSINPSAAHTYTYSPLDEDMHAW